MYKFEKTKDCIEFWNESVKDNPLINKTIRTQTEIDKKWNENCEGYARNTMSDNSIKIQTAILNVLQEDGLIDNNSNILDVGAGTGNYSINFSEKANKVYAVEPSIKMKQFLQDNLERRNINNVEVIDENWNDINLDDYNWKNKFDLSFANLCPGIYNPKGFIKFIESSSKWCFMSTFSGIQLGSAFKDIWRILFKEELVYSNYDIYLPFSFLYTCGYKPKLWFVDYKIERNYSIEEAVDVLIYFFWRYIECNQKQIDIIRDYVIKRSHNGIYHYERKICQGMMYWRV